MTTLGDLLVEFTERPDPGAAPPVLTLTERNGFVRQSDRFKKRLAIEDTSGYKIVRRHDIAFNPYLLWAGAVAFNTIVDEGVVSPLYPTFRVRDGHDPRFVARLLLAPTSILAYDGIAFGSVPRRRRSSVADFLALHVRNVPALDEQRRIAAILDAADAIRTKRRSALAQLDSVPSAMFRELFGKVSWPTRPLGELADITSGVTKGRKLKGPTVEVPYLAVANVQAGALALNTVKTIPATPDEIDRFRLLAGDLVLTEGGDPDKLGRGTVWRDELPLAIHQNHIFRVRITAEVRPDFASAFIGSPLGRNYFLKVAKQTTGIATINKGQLSQFPMLVPPLPQQDEFVSRAKAIDAERARVQRALDADDELFASLQARAFSGGL